MISSRMFRIHLVIGCFNVLCSGQDIPQGNYPSVNFRVEPKPPISFLSPDYLLLSLLDHDQTTSEPYYILVLIKMYRPMFGSFSLKVLEICK